MRMCANGETSRGSRAGHRRCQDRVGML